MKCIEFSPIKISYWRRFSLLLSQCLSHLCGALAPLQSGRSRSCIPSTWKDFDASGKFSARKSKHKKQPVWRSSEQVRSGAAFKVSTLPFALTTEWPAFLCSLTHNGCQWWALIDNDGRMLIQRGSYESRWISMNCNLQSHEIRIKHSLRWMLLSNKRVRKGARRVPVG